MLQRLRLCHDSQKTFEVNHFSALLFLAFLSFSLTFVLHYVGHHLLKQSLQPTPSLPLRAPSLSFSSLLPSPTLGGAFIRGQPPYPFLRWFVNRLTHGQWHFFLYKLNFKSIKNLQNCPYFISNSPFWYNYIFVLGNLETSIDPSKGCILGFRTPIHEP